MIPRVALALFAVGVLSREVSACSPPLGPRPTIEQLFSQASVVAWVRVIEPLANPKLGRGARVEVVESFKGPASFEAAYTSGSTCGLPMHPGKEYVMFMDGRFYTETVFTALWGDEIAKALPSLRQLRTAR